MLCHDFLPAPYTHFRKLGKLLDTNNIKYLPLNQSMTETMTFTEKVGVKHRRFIPRPLSCCRTWNLGLSTIPAAQFKQIPPHHQYKFFARIYHPAYSKHRLSQSWKVGNINISHFSLIKQPDCHRRLRHLKHFHCAGEILRLATRRGSHADICIFRSG